MEYIVLDMEWNQALNFSEMVKDPVFLTGEIIQIGAIKLNQTLEVVDSFNERWKCQEMCSRETPKI